MDRQDLGVGILSISSGFPHRHTFCVQGGRNSTGMSSLLGITDFIRSGFRAKCHVMFVIFNAVLLNVFMWCKMWPECFALRNVPINSMTQAAMLTMRTC